MVKRGANRAWIMRFLDAVRIFEDLEQESSRLGMTRILREGFDQVPRELLGVFVSLMQGKVGPDWESWEYGLADKMVVKALEKASGTSNLPALVKDLGDIGDAARQAFSQGGRQVGLFGRQHLELEQVFKALQKIAQTTGSGSQEEKQRHLLQMLVNADPPEARFLTRIVTGRLRLGVGDMSILDALTAWVRKVPVQSVTEMSEEERQAHETVRHQIEHAYDRASDLGRVAHALAEGGLDAVDAIHLTAGTPMRAMAAERSKSLEEILERHRGATAVEDKYDGLRVQAHVRKGSTRLFSRRLDDLTDQFPDAVKLLEDALQVDEAIVEGECIAIDPETGALRPFQEISRRRGRKTGLGEDGVPDMTQEIPVALYLFDCLQTDGVEHVHESYELRRGRIEHAFQIGGRVHLSELTICRDVASMEQTFYAAVSRGAEGIMCKDLMGVYKAGNRGFDWIKFKTDYTADLVDTMDLVVLGAFKGRGRRAGWYGALLMGVYDEETSRYQSICKLGTGFDDATLMGLEAKFEHHVVADCPKNVDTTLEPDVWIAPEIVMEVEAAEISISPTHHAGWGRVKADAGLAARFPRFTGRWRDDKSAELATSASEIVRMYQEQGKVRSDAG